MTTRPFRRGEVKAGDRLVPALFPDAGIYLRFKGMGHFGSVIAAWEKPLPGYPQDVIGPQRDFLVPTPETTT